MQAVNISDGGVKLIALDHRVATYEKLDQLQLGLRDSKKMIDIKPELAKVRTHENGCKVTLNI
jgi:F-box/TPR repeat protein Pof3